MFYEKKEYLVKVGENYEYRLIPKDEAPCDGWVEIPKGADYMTMPNSYFWRDHETEWAYCDTKEVWNDNDGETMQEYLDASCGGKIVWERSKKEYLMQGKNTEHLKQSVSELSINDQCVEIEEVRQKHSHYKKDVSHLDVIDVYRILELFDVSNPCLQHAIKKLLCAGKRGAKDTEKDIQEAIDTLLRYQEMRKEDLK